MNMTVIKKTIDRILLLSLALLILGFNLYLVWDWLWGDGPANLGSIEVSYVSMAKFLINNRPHLSWAPFWYLGFPFHLFYTPILPVLVAVIKSVTQASFWQAYRWISGAGLVLGPVSLFFMVWYLSKNKIAALISGILYSIMPNIFYFILPSGEVKKDSFTPEFFDPRRLVNVARWGEGPHIFSLVFLPLAGLFFFKALKEKNKLSIFLAAFFIGLTAMTNAVGFYGLVLFLASIFVIKMFFSPKGRKRNLILTLLMGVLTYGLVAFWYNLSFIGNFFGESGGVLKNWLNIFPWGLLFLIGGFFLLLFILKVVIRNEAIAAVFLWALVLLVIVAVYYLSAPPEFWQKRIELAPQALRLMTEVDMGLAALLGLVFGAITNSLTKKNKILGNFLALILGGGLVAVCFIYGWSYAPAVKESIQAKVKLEETEEKKIADWASANLDSTKGERLFLTGNFAFYLNYFSDVWQLRGGLYQAMTHPWPEHIYYQLRMGKDGKLAKAWLKIINAKYAIVDASSEIKYKGKFNILSLSEKLGESQIYRVPLANSSPVKIVNLKAMGELGAPLKADEKEPIFAYLDWFEQINPQKATFEKINNDHYLIKAKVGEGEGILVQMAYDQGFRATSNHGNCWVKKDPLGFMVLFPPKPGEYEVVLKHGRTWKIWLGYLISLGTILFLIFWAFCLGKERSLKEEKA